MLCGRNMNQGREAERALTAAAHYHHHYCYRGLLGEIPPSRENVPVYHTAPWIRSRTQRCKAITCRLIPTHKMNEMCHFARTHTHTSSYIHGHAQMCTHFLSHAHHVHSHALTISLYCELILAPPPQPLHVPYTHAHVPSITTDSCLLYVIPSNQTEFHGPIKGKVVFFYLVILSPLHQSQTFTHNQALHPHLLIYCIITLTHHISPAQTHTAIFISLTSFNHCLFRQ